MNISIIGMPLFYGCDRPGVEKGPEILRKNNLVEIFNEHNTIEDLGDIDIKVIDEKDKYFDNSKMKYLAEVIASNTRLSDKVYSALTDNTFPVIVGGDHSLALGSIAGVSKYYGDDLAVIWIDAHGDLNTEETSPSGNIHGMPLAASIGVGYEGLTSILFKGVKVKPENIFILACRDLDEGEVELIKRLNINTWGIDEIKEKGTDIVVKELLEKLKKTGVNNIHLSYDIDCLDPEYVPGTGTPVDNGLTFEESTDIVKGIFSTSLVKSMDFVEYNPELDNNEKTKETCLELLKLFSEEIGKY